MEKSALTVISNDWHITSTNTEQIIDLISQKIKVAREYQITTLICLGDVFQSRQAQPLSTLKCFEQILSLIDEAGMILYCISGNHDKTDYSSSDSFLDQFQWHPTLNLIRNYSQISIDSEGTIMHFIPYFEEETWLTKLDKVFYTKGVKDILMSHQALTGSVNNDGSSISNSLKPSLFKNFDKVFLGHYHNKQQIGKNIYHLPSIQANNFGEDNDKGFTVLFDDGSHELITSKFPEFHTIKIDLDKVSKKELNSLKKSGAGLIKDSGANIRFKIEGSEDKVKALKSEEFTTLGIDIKKEHKVLERSIAKAETGEILVYDEETIITKFDEFCEQEEYIDLDKGKNYLIKKLKNGSGL